MRAFVCVCVCVCVTDKQTDRQTDRAQCDLFYSAGQHGTASQPNIMQLTSRERTQTNESEWTEKVKIKQSKRFLAVGETFFAIF